MAALTGITGALTSWGSGSIHAQLAATGTQPASFTLNLEGEDFDVTAFESAGVGQHIKGLQGWSFDATAQLKVPDHGALGLVTYTAGYTTNLNAWTLDVQRAEFDVTAFAATEKAYIPGKYDWGGSFAGFLDGTTALVAVNNGSEPATGTFKYQEKGGTDNTWSGSIFTTSANVSVSPQAVNAVSYNFRGTGALTQSTPSAGAGVLPNGAIALTAAETVVLTASSGRTYTGSAFWTMIGLNVGVGQATVLRMRGRGTGALTIA